MNLSVFTDGASRGNPGKAAYGFVFYEEGSRSPLYTEAMYLGHKTNNEAEYIAVYQAVKKIEELGYATSTITVYLDSELVVKQLKGIYKVKKKELQEIHSSIRSLIDRKTISFVHIPREKNSMADGLANYALDHTHVPGTTFKHNYKDV